MTPLVSVWMITYNQEEFIAQAIESVLMQKTSFDYEIIIGEDFSKDNTRNICAEYQKKFPDKIKLLFSKKNIGMTANAIRVFDACKGKYIALLEGDDCWTDPCKLQKQVDFLEANPQIAGCFHDVINVDENTKTIKENYYKSLKSVYTQQDCITWMGGAYATCSLVFCSTAIKDIPKWTFKCMSDYVLDILITEHGDIAYIPANMGAYRIHKGGTWQGSSAHRNLEETVYRYRMCLTNLKYKREYVQHFKKSLSNLSLLIYKAYHIEGKWLKELKYAWYHFYYMENKNMEAFEFLIKRILDSLSLRKIKNSFTQH